MKLLVYLRFLRPLRTLLVIAIYTGIAEGWGQHLLHFNTGTASFLALAVALPLLLGVFIAGAAHEPMHRNFALVLPNLRRRQREAAVFSLLIAAFATTCASTWAAPTVSPVATFGLACALIALPCLDRHQLMGGLTGALAAFLSWLLLGVIVGAKLTLALNAAPWLFLLGGLAFSVASLVQGFSRESLRVRADTLFVAYQTNVFSYLFHRGMMARWQAEIIARKNRQKKGWSMSGRDWTVRAVGATSLDWMRVLWHVNFGGRKRSSFLRVQLQFSVVILFSVVALLGFAHFFDQKEYWATLAQSAAPDPKFFMTNAATGMGVNFMILLPGMATLCALRLFPPQIAYPISRARLARVVFWLTVTQWAAALMVPATTIFFISLIGQAMSGKFLPGFGLPALLAADLALAVLLPLMFAAGTVRRSSFRILIAVPVVLAIISVGVTRYLWSCYVLTLPGVLCMLVATAASQWLLWHRLRVQYAISDLPLASESRGMSALW